MTPEQAGQFQALIQERSRGKPVAYLTGKKEFMGLEFHVTPEVLIPRPETEHLVEEGLRWLRSRNSAGSREGAAALEWGGELRILDLGTGSGCIAISLALHLPEAKLVATDLREEILQVAAENASRHGVRERITFLPGDLFAPVQGMTFALIVSNPPYVASSEMTPELAWEPSLALDGGEDGLIFYRRIIPEAGKFLVGGGALCLEVGYGQVEKVRGLFSTPPAAAPPLAALPAAAPPLAALPAAGSSRSARSARSSRSPRSSTYGYKNIRVTRDLAGIERVILGEWHGPSRG